MWLRPLSHHGARVKCIWPHEMAGDPQRRYQEGLPWGGEERSPEQWGSLGDLPPPRAQWSSSGGGFFFPGVSGEQALNLPVEWQPVDLTACSVTKQLTVLAGPGAVLPHGRYHGNVFKR